MKVKEITFRLRNDYSAIMECEHCGNEQMDENGYSDENYRVNVIPAMYCDYCGKNRAGETEADYDIPFKTMVLQGE